MRILFLAHRIPYPPNKGDKIRSFHELRAMLDRGHEVHLLAFADDAKDVRHAATLADLCASATILPLDRRRATLRALATLPRRAPLSVGYFGSARMRRAVGRASASARPDLIFAYSAMMAAYVPDELAARTVVDLTDVDSEKWRAYAERLPGPLAWLYALECRRLRRWEGAILERVAYTVVSTEREAALLAPADSPVSQVRLRVVTNGVDLQYYRPRPILRPPPDRPSAPVPRLVFVGVMNYYPNVEAACFLAEEIFPRVRRCVPSAELLIVGSNPTRRVRRLGERPGVSVTGHVEDVRPYLVDATACVVPLRIARGVPNKVLEAMASGCAVVATPAAVAALRVVDGEQVLIGRDTDELARAIVRVVSDDALRLGLGARARRFVEAEHRWAPHMRRLIDLLESVGVVSPAGSEPATPPVRPTAGAAREG
jgi:sugar transferase (PEP-CTERM/EpsH1 system associated)